jgi:deoxycytidylate deaminase
MKDEVIKRSDLRYFDMAREVAENSDFGAIKIGCVLVYQGKILAVGHNSRKTSPAQKRYNRYRQFNKGTKPIQHSNHAELAAIKSVQYTVAQDIDWKRVKMFIYRIAPGLPNGMGCAKPCPGCMRLIKDTGIQDIYYSDNDGYCYQRVMR